MNLLIKDHKRIEPGALLPPRPVMDESSSIGNPLITILSEYVEALADNILEPAEVSSIKEILIQN